LKPVLGVAFGAVPFLPDKNFRPRDSAFLLIRIPTQTKNGEISTHSNFKRANLMDTMDAACLRRFSHKIKFDYLNPDQRWAMFVQEFCRLGGNRADTVGVEEQVRGMEGLAPGDFEVVHQDWPMCGDKLNTVKVVERLMKEVEIRGSKQGRVGFL